MTKVPMRRYDHDQATYHMGQYKAIKWDKKIAKKYSSPNQVASRKAPFTLKEIRGRYQEKHLALVRLENQLKVGNQSIDNLTLNEDLTISKKSEVSPGASIQDLQKGYNSSRVSA